MGNKGDTEPVYYTAAEAVERSRIRPDIFAWIVHTSRIKLPTVGNRAVYTQETIDAILNIFRKKDPEGRFLCREERKNGPYKKRKPAAAGRHEG